MDTAEEVADASQSFAAGLVVRGQVNRLSDDTAFVRVDGVEVPVYAEVGRIWNGRGAYPWPFAVGYEGPFAVLAVNRQQQPVALGYVSPVAWEAWVDAGQRYPVGSQHRGEVIAVFSTGAGIALGRGITGWLTLAELQRRSAVSHPSELLSIGKSIEVVVSAIDPQRMELFLGVVERGEPKAPPDRPRETKKRTGLVFAVTRAGGRPVLFSVSLFCFFCLESA
jgi:small subunit ribosomal protein S1